MHDKIVDTQRDTGSKARKKMPSEGASGIKIPKQALLVFRVGTENLEVYGKKLFSYDRFSPKLALCGKNIPESLRGYHAAHPPPL